MTLPKFTVPAQTEFAKRVRLALEHGVLDATEAAKAIEEILPRNSKGEKRKVKPQTIQYMAQKAHKSNLTPYLAKVTKVDSDWLLDASGTPPSPEMSSATHNAPGTGLLNDSKREQIGARLFHEIDKCKQSVADVAARLRMTTAAFRDRAAHGDLSLEDLAEIVLFLGPAASLDFIVLGRHPMGDTVGPVADIMKDVKARARTVRRT